MGPNTNRIFSFSFLNMLIYTTPQAVKLIISTTFENLNLTVGLFRYKPWPLFLSFRIKESEGQFIVSDYSKASMCNSSFKSL